MRNKNSNVRVVKRKLNKCKDVCRSYSNIQFSYASLLEKDDTVEATVAELAQILAAALPAEDNYNTYAWDVEVPETFEGMLPANVSL